MAGPRRDRANVLAIRPARQAGQQQHHSPGRSTAARTVTLSATSSVGAGSAAAGGSAQNRSERAGFVSSAESPSHCPESTSSLDGGDPAQSRVRRSNQSGLDLRDRTPLGLQSLDGDDLRQMPRPVQRRPPSHGSRPVHQADGGVPPDRSTVGYLTHPAVRRSGYAGPASAAATRCTNSACVHSGRLAMTSTHDTVMRQCQCNLLPVG